MRVVKAVKQNYQPSEQIMELLEDFRLMVNDCIRIGLARNITSMRSLSLACYHALEPYDVATCYRLTAVSRAAGILKNYRKALRKNTKAKKPYADRLVLTDCYSFKIQGKRLRLTLRAHEYAYIDLNPHTLSVISGQTVRSITLTTRTLSICFSKETAEIEPAGLMGIDRNLDNVTLATSGVETKTFDLSKATEIKTTYREVKSHLIRNDARIRKRVFGKYGEKQRNKVNQILHHVSKSIATKAKEEKLGIVMEKLTGIRKLYRKGNYQGGNFRARMNLWSFAELQRQIEYKAKWEGLKVIYVDAWGTSSRCSICGSKTYPNEHRTLCCPNCNISIDRDVNAARNILAKGGLRFKPDGQQSEGMVAERHEEPNPQTRLLEVQAEVSPEV